MLGWNLVFLTLHRGFQLVWARQLELTILNIIISVVTDELVEFETNPVEVQNFREITKDQ